MERLSIIKIEEKRLSDLLCDQSKPWSEVRVHYEPWLALIREWKEIDRRW